MNEFVEQFLLESRDLIAQATDDLLTLEQQPDEHARLDGAFRAVHTLKGGAGIVEFFAMARMLHAAEDILSALRSAAKPVSSHVVSECLACLDLVTRWLDDLQRSGELPAGADLEADEMVRRFNESVDDAAAPISRTTDWLARIPLHRADRTKKLVAVHFVPGPDAYFQGEDPLAVIATIPGLVAIDLSLTEATRDLDAMNPFVCGLDIVALATGTVDAVEKSLSAVRDRIEVRSVAEQPSATVLSKALIPQAVALLNAQILLLEERSPDGLQGRLAAASRSAINVMRHIGMAKEATKIELALANSRDGNGPDALTTAIRDAMSNLSGEPVVGLPAAAANQPSLTRSLRVNMERIDALVRLAGELTVVKNAVGHAAKLAEGGVDPNTVARRLRDQHALFDRLTGELRNAVLRIRVLPLRQVFRRFPRLVREIASGVGKSAHLVTEGEATEADAAIVEALFEPLLHVLRNAIDHGIEDAKQRAAAGKADTGTIVLRARRELDNVVIEVEDDGRGIDIARVREVAGVRRVVATETLAVMGDQEIIDLIFAPGFSTATAVTGLSGRGVGMDSVRTAVGQLGGRVSVESRPGQGAIVRLVLPFTLMMTRVMTVETAGQVFGLPLDTVVETAMIPRDLIVPIGTGHAFVLRDRTVPLVNLAETLGLKQIASGERNARVVISVSNGQLCGVEVERLGQRMDVMLKPMDGLLGGMKGVSGTTLLGDGRVLIVLDVQEMFN